MAVTLHLAAPPLTLQIGRMAGGPSFGEQIILILLCNLSGSDRVFDNVDHILRVTG
jgi:hypothetical protein